MNEVDFGTVRSFTDRRPRHGGLWAALLALAIVSVLLAPGTLRSSSLHAMLPLAGALAIAAVGQTLVIQQRGFDLSVPGAMVVVSIVAGLSVADGRSVISTAVLCAGVAVTVGLINGFLVTVVAITPIVATLAVNALLMGAVWTLSDGLPVAAPDGLVSFVRSTPLGVPAVVIVAVVITIALATYQSRTTFGFRFLCAGASPAASRAAAYSPRLQVVLGYVICACCAGVAGILLSGYAGTSTVDLGTPYLLPAVAAVIVGGTPLKGGGGSVFATALAALFVTQLVQVTLALGAPTSSQLLVQSVAIVLAVVFRSWPLSSMVRKDRSRRRARERTAIPTGP